MGVRSHLSLSWDDNDSLALGSHALMYNWNSLKGLFCPFLIRLAKFILYIVKYVAKFVAMFEYEHWNSHKFFPLYDFSQKMHTVVFELQGDPQEPDIFKINSTQLFFK